MFRSRIRPSARRRVGLLAGVAACVLLTPSLVAANSILVFMGRLDDSEFPLNAFTAGIDVELTALGVTAVTVTPANASPIAMEFSVDDGAWLTPDDLLFTSLAAMKIALQGTWTVEITGGASASTTTFALDANSLADGSFLPTPSNLSPAHGTAGVSSNPTLSWDASGIVSPYALGVDVQSGVVSQEAFSLEGNISLGDTSWQPPLALASGSASWSVFYVADPDLTVAVIGDPVVGSGSIVWSTHAFGPVDWPVGRPVLALLSESAVLVTVPEAEDALQSGAALAALGLLAWMRSRRRSLGDAVA